MKNSFIVLLFVLLSAACSKQPGTQSSINTITKPVGQAHPVIQTIQGNIDTVTGTVYFGCPEAGIEEDSIRSYSCYIYHITKDSFVIVGSRRITEECIEDTIDVYFSGKINDSCVYNIMPKTNDTWFTFKTVNDSLYFDWGVLVNLSCVCDDGLFSGGFAGASIKHTRRL